MGPEHLQILESVVGPGTNAPQIPRGNCIIIRKISWVQELVLDYVRK